MDPKLRPSFEEIGKILEEIMSHLPEEELERDRKLQPTAKGKRSDQIPKLDPQEKSKTVRHSFLGKDPWSRSGRELVIGVPHCMEWDNYLPCFPQEKCIIKVLLILPESSPLTVFQDCWRKSLEGSGQVHWMTRFPISLHVQDVLLGCLEASQTFSLVSPHLQSVSWTPTTSHEMVLHVPQKSTLSVHAKISRVGRSNSLTYPASLSFPLYLIWMHQGLELCP